LQLSLPAPYAEAIRRRHRDVGRRRVASRELTAAMKVVAWDDQGRTPPKPPCTESVHIRVVLMVVFRHDADRQLQEYQRYAAGKSDARLKEILDEAVLSYRASTASRTGQFRIRSAQ
jgi:hypothetical protein